MVMWHHVELYPVGEGHQVCGREPCMDLGARNLSAPSLTRTTPAPGLRRKETQRCIHRKQYSPRPNLQGWRRPHISCLRCRLGVTVHCACVSTCSPSCKHVSLTRTLCCMRMFVHAMSTAPAPDCCALDPPCYDSATGARRTDAHALGLPSACSTPGYVHAGV